MKVYRYKGGKTLPHKLYLKPSEVRDVTLNIKGETGTDTLSSSAWTSCPEGLIIGTPTDSTQETAATVTAPSEYGNYVLRIVSVTSGGETYNTRIKINVAEGASCS